MNSIFANTVFASISLAVTAGVVAVSASPAAAAVPTGETSHAVVRYQDLDLAEKGGRADLDARIRLAAAKVCPSASGTIDFAAMRCRDAAIDQAHRDVADRLAVRTSAVTQTAAP